MKIKFIMENASGVLEQHYTWIEDEASIILKTADDQLRLPKLSQNYQEFPSSTARVIREVESERELANIAGIFYELPLSIKGTCDQTEY